MLNNCGFCKNKIPEAENNKKPNWGNSFYVYLHWGFKMSKIIPLSWGYSHSIRLLLRYTSFLSNHLILLFCSFLMFSSRPPINLCQESGKCWDLLSLKHCAIYYQHLAEQHSTKPELINCPYSLPYMRLCVLFKRRLDAYAVTSQSPNIYFRIFLF